MSELNYVDILVSGWEDKIDDLENEYEEIEGSQDGYYKGSWDAAFERAEPKIQKEIIQKCIEDIEGCDNAEGLIESMAGWRKEADDLDKRILGKKEWFRSTMKKAQLETCVEDFIETVPDTEFEKCNRCGNKKKAVSDKRYAEGYRWECIECSFL